MKRRWFVLTAILAMAAVTVFLTNQVTQAQRPDRGERPNRAGAERRGGGGMRGFMNPTSIIDNSWTDLTFSLKVDDETLIKARPVYQKHRDSLEKAVKEASSSGDFRAVREAMGKIGDGFQTDLKSVLTEEQIAKLDALQQERMQQMMNRGGGRGGGGGRGR
jgi:Spy/CpxP family protein refolding chaperone